MEVTCPSGLRGEIRELFVADEDLLAELSEAGDARKKLAIMDTMIANVWTRTLDPGPYGTMPKLEVDRLLAADGDLILLRMRQASWGDDLDLRGYRCDKGHLVEGSVKLSACPIKRITPEVAKAVREGKPLTVTLPKVKRTVAFMPLTCGLQRQIDMARDEFPKDRATQSLVNRIASIEGFDKQTQMDVESKMDVPAWIKRLPSSDASVLRAAMRDADPDVDLLADIACMHAGCGKVVRVNVVSSPDFFLPVAQASSERTSTR